MDFYDISPTDKNVYETFVGNAVDRNAKVFKFISLINQIDISCSISLDGAWGSGKTIFVKQVKMILDILNNNRNSSDFSDEEREAIKNVFGNLCDKTTTINSIKPHVSIYFDAWLNDNDADPLISLVHSIAKDFSCRYKFDHAPNLSKVISSVTMNFVSGITNIDVNKIFDDCHFTNDLEEFEKTKELEQTISEFLDSILHEHGERIIVFIDELDRCKPTYAVKLLERIKHYFSNQKITFVFSTNVKELVNTIKKLYGSDFDADRYLDKFFDLRLALPPINVTDYLLEIGYGDTEEDSEIIKKIISDYSLTMREICRFIKIYKLTKPSDLRVNNFLYSRGPVSKAVENGFHFLKTCVLPLLVALQLTDSKKFNNFITGKDSQPLVDLLHNIDFPYLSSLDISSMPIYETKGNSCIKDVLSCLYQKIYNPSFEYDFYLYGNNLDNLKFDPKIVKVVHESLGLISEFNKFE